MWKRKEKSLQGQLDPNTIARDAYDVFAGGQGHFDVAPKVQILGALNVAVSVGYGSVVRCINTDAVVHYVAIGATGMAAPTGMADGIAIPAGQLVVINTADIGGYIRSDSNKVGGYLLVRDTVLFSAPDANS